MDPGALKNPIFSYECFGAYHGAQSAHSTYLWKHETAHRECTDLVVFREMVSLQRTEMSIRIKNAPNMPASYQCLVALGNSKSQEDLEQSAFFSHMDCPVDTTYSDRTLIAPPVSR